MILTGILNMAGPLVARPFVNDSNAMSSIAVDQERRVRDIDDLILPSGIVRSCVMLENSKKILLARSREVRVRFVHE